MKHSFTPAIAGLTLLLSSTQVNAAGELNLYNWGNYTSPELIEKFEKQFDVKVTITDYDSNETALAKVRAGGHGFDLAVPSHSHVPIWIQEGLVANARVDQMENFKHVDEQWRDPVWDPGRQYSAPWQWGSVGVIVDTSVYSGEINTSSLVFDPPEELVGKINVPPEMLDVIHAAVLYLGGDICTGDKTFLKQVRDKLVEAKPKWKSMDYGMIEKFAGRDIAASLYWNGAAFRAREKNTDVRFGYPAEGYGLWADAVVLLADAKNVENARHFMNFIMEPENAALMSSFARYANSIKGPEAFMPDDMTSAPEVIIPEALRDKGQFYPTCPPDVQKIYTAIWTDLQK